MVMEPNETRENMQDAVWAGMENLENRLMLAGDIAVAIDALTTLDTTPGLSGTIDDAAASILVSVNGSNYAATNNGATWTLADDMITPALADGTYDIVVLATNAGTGEWGTDATTGELVIDTTDPVVAITSLVTNDTTPAIAGTIVDADDATTLSIVINGVTYTSGAGEVTINAGADTWAIADGVVAPALTEGVYEVAATATDTVGHVGTDATANELVVDTTDPTTTVDALITNDATPELTGTLADAGGSDLTNATINVNVDGADYAATNNGDGTWTVADGAIAALAENTYEVVVTVTDEAGNTGTDGTNTELLVDLTDPTTTVNALATTDTTPELTGTLADGGGSDVNNATINVNVDGADYAATNNANGTWTVADGAIAALTNGTYEVVVTVTDEAGNTGTDGTNNELVVDTIDPVVTVDRLVTTDTTPAIAGTIVDADDATALSIVINGVTYTSGAAEVTINAGANTWAIADGVIAPALGLEAVYDVAVTATDSAGNVGTDLTTDDLIVDTVNPTDLNTDALITNTATPTITGTITDTDIEAVVTVTIAGNPAGVATNNGDGTWSFTVPGGDALAEATYDVSVSATDGAGNVGGPTNTAFALLVDLTDPTTTVDALVTTDTTPELTGTLADGGGSDVNNATINVNVDGADYAATNNADGTWTVADGAIAALAEGTYEVVVTVTDEGGNTGTDVTTDELVVDTTDPVVTVDPLITNVISPEITGTLVDADDATALSIVINGVTYTSGAAEVTIDAGADTWAIAAGVIAPDLGEAVYNVTATATDTAGNASIDPTIGELIVDLTDPTTTVDALATTDITPELTGTLADGGGSDVNNATIIVNVDGIDYAATNNGDGTWTVADGAIAPLLDNTYEVVVNVFDEAGNLGIDGTNNELVVDTTDPVVTVDDDQFMSDSTPAVTGTIVDADDATTLSIVINGVTYTSAGGDITINAGADTWELTDDVIAPALTDGTYAVAVTATDTLGHVGTTTESDLVIDTVAPADLDTDALLTNGALPTITGTITDDDPAAVIMVTVAANPARQATNNGDGTWTLTVPGGDDLAEGVHDVSVTATDAAGNVGGPTNTVGAVTVDLTDPTVTIDALATTDTTPELTGTIADGGGAGGDPNDAVIEVTVDGTTYAATNNNDGTWTLADDTIAELASTTYDVVVTATDLAGNIGTDATTDELDVTTEVDLGGAGVVKKVQFLDADGSKVTVSLSGKDGAATLVLSSTSIVSTEVIGKKVVVTSEDGSTIEGLVLTADTKGLSIKTSKGTVAGTTLGGLSGNFVLGKLNAKKVDLIGDGIAMGGANGVIKKLSLQSIQSDVTMGGTYEKGVAIKVARDIDGADITLDQSSIKSLTAGRMNDSTVFVGVQNAADGADAGDLLDLPVVGDLTDGLMIKKLTVKGYKGAAGDLFTNTNIAADTIGKVSLKSATLDNADVVFGLTTNDLGKLKVRQADGTYTYGKTWLDAAADDLTIRLV